MSKTRANKKLAIIIDPQFKIDNIVLTKKDIDYLIKGIDLYNLLYKETTPREDRDNLFEFRCYLKQLTRVDNHRKRK